MTDTQQALLDLEEVNKFVGTNLIDEKLKWWNKKYKHYTGWYLRFQLNSNKFIITNRLGVRLF